MKARLLPLMLGIAAASASAGEIGAPELTAAATDLTIGISYYYDQSAWTTGSPLGDRVTSDVVRDGYLAKLAFGLHENLEAVAKFGGESIQNDPGASEYSVSANNDSFYSLALKGIVYRNGPLAAGPFVQYSKFSDYTISGNVSDGLVLHPVTATIKKLSTLETGLAAQYRINKFDVFGGAYFYRADVDASGSFDAIPFKNKPEEDANFGAYIGANYLLTPKWMATAEVHMASDAGAAIGINYLIGHKTKDPAVVTRTEKVVERVVETVYVEKVAPAAGPARIETEVHFASGSAEIDAEHWVNVRDFADFMRKHPKAHGIIEGHCDCDGSDDYNIKLSERRSQAIEIMMIKIFGIEPERLSIESFGENKPVANNTTPEGKAANRRVRLVGIAE
ncbi:MAG: OmpA family protein [bacterium]|nr:OmpA family protein [bacterium]